MELRKRGYFPNKSNIFSNGACNMRNRTYSMSLQDKENLSRGRALVARQAHNLEVVGSIPAPATNLRLCRSYDRLFTLAFWPENDFLMSA